MLNIFAELSAYPASGWMVGDHRTDILAARAAGCRSLWCSWGFGRRDELEPDAIANDPLDVVSLVDA